MTAQRSATAASRVDERRGRPRLLQMAAFSVVGVVALLTLLVPWPHSGQVAAVAAATFVLTVAITVAAMRQRRRSWLDAIGPYLFFGCLAVLRHLATASDHPADVAPLALLPILWFALFGNRRDLVVSAVLTALVFLTPVVLVGPPSYPLGDLRLAALWTAVAICLGPIVHQVVAALRERTVELRTALARVDAINRGATLNAIITTDRHGRVTSFSPGAEHLLGYAAEEAERGLHLVDLYSPGEVAEVCPDDQSFDGLVALAAREHETRLWTWRTRDGDARVMRVSLTPLREGAATTGYLALAVDVTTAVETSAELAESEERWRVLMRNLPDTTVLMVDREHTVELVTGAGATTLAVQSAAGRRLSDISRHGEVLGRMVDEAMAGQESRVELPSTASGSEQDIVVTPLMTTEDDTEITHALVISRDISATREKERHLAAARDRAEQLFAESPQAMVVVAADGRIKRSNGAFCALFGGTPDGFHGRLLQDLGDGTSPEVTAHLAAVLHAGRATDTWTLDRGSQQVHLTLTSGLLRGDAEGTQVLVNVTDVTESHAYEQRLAHLADHDSLTGLANRRRFDVELLDHLAFCQRHGAQGALLLLDLDHFKEVNDTLGHAAGDRLLTSIAHAVRAQVRSTDLVARLGGDEFCILVRHGGYASAERVAAAVLGAIRDLTAMMGGVTSEVSASVGVVPIGARHANVEDLVKEADVAMYGAKQAGRNRWLLADDAAS